MSKRQARTGGKLHIQRISGLVWGGGWEESDTGLGEKVSRCGRVHTWSLGSSSCNDSYASCRNDGRRISRHHRANKKILHRAPLSQHSSIATH